MKLIFSFFLIAIWLPIKAQYWQPLGGGFNSAVLGLYSDSSVGKVYAVGQFYYADTNNLQVNNIAAWNGGTWDTLCYGVAHPWHTFAVSKYKNEIYSDGRFFSTFNNGGKFNGTCWDSLGLGVIGDIYDFYEMNNELYVAGGFTTAGGIQSPLIAKWDGANWYGMNCPFENFAKSIMEYNGLLYIGGNIFDSIGTNVDIISWDGTTYSVVGGGIFGGISGVEAMVVYHGELYVGGYFTTSAGNAGNHIMKWNGTTWSDVGGGANNEVRCLAIFNDELYVGGSFTTIGGGLPIPHLAKWNGTNWSEATPSIIQGNGAIESIVFLANTMYIGGGFTYIDTIQYNNIAKYTFPTSIIENNGEINFSLYPMPSTTSMILTLTSPQKSNAELFINDISGRQLKKEILQPNAVQKEIDISELAAGIYFISFESESGRVTKKFIKE